MEMLRKLSVINDDFSMSISIHGKEVALLKLESHPDDGVSDVVEATCSKDNIKELISMLEYASIFLD